MSGFGTSEVLLLVMMTLWCWFWWVILLRPLYRFVQRRRQQ
jgi:hypothetical protein